jgi:hypothetical protein
MRLCYCSCRNGNGGELGSRHLRSPAMGGISCWDVTQHETGLY